MMTMHVLRDRIGLGGRRGGFSAEPLLMNVLGFGCQGSESILELKIQYLKQMTHELQQ